MHTTQPLAAKSAMGIGWFSRCSTTSVLALELSRTGRSSSPRERDEGGISRILRVRSASNLAISWSADKVSISMPTPGRTRNRRRASVEPLWLMHASAADNVTPVGAGKPGLARKITRQFNVGRRSADTRIFPPEPFASVQLFSILRTRLQPSTLPVLHIDITLRRRQQRACHRRPGQRRRRKGWRSWAITSLPPHDHVSLPKALNTRCLRPHITDTLGSPIRPPAIAHATSSALARPAGHAASQHRHFPPRLAHLPVTEPYTACEHGR